MKKFRTFYMSFYSNTSIKMVIWLHRFWKFCSVKKTRNNRSQNMNIATAILENLKHLRKDVKGENLNVILYSIKRYEFRYAKGVFENSLSCRFQEVSFCFYRTPFCSYRWPFCDFATNGNSRYSSFSPDAFALWESRLFHNNNPYVNKHI